MEASLKELVRLGGESGCRSAMEAKNVIENLVTGKRETRLVSNSHLMYWCIRVRLILCSELLSPRVYSYTPTS